MEVFGRKRRKNFVPRFCFFCGKRFTLDYDLSIIVIMKKVVQEDGMARGQIKKVPVQANETVFALDIGTRSIIGMVGVVEEGKVRILAIEKVEHTE